MKQAGEYTVRFDSDHCSTGLYFYLVRAAGVRPENTGLTHTAYLVFATKKS